MVGTAVAVQSGARGMMSIDLRKVNYGAASKVIEKYMNSVGGSAGGQRFPGTQYQFKLGEWKAGYGDKAKRVKPGTRFVFNIPNAVATWMKWEDKKPIFADLTFPALGDEPIARDTLGDDDKDEWETNDKGQPQDPWRPVLVIPIREVDGDTINHVFLDTVSKVIAGFNLFQDMMGEMVTHTGELPVIEIGTDKTSRDRKVVDKKGRERTEKQTWDVPTFECVDWVEATEADNPKKGGVQVTADDDADLGEVTTKARKSKPEPKKAAKPVGKQSRRQIEVDEDDDI